MAFRVARTITSWTGPTLALTAALLFFITAMLDGCAVRASQNGVYHTPESPWYERAHSPERCFTGPQEAEAAGYRSAGYGEE